MPSYTDSKSGLSFYYYGDEEAPAGAGKGAQEFSKIIASFQEAGTQFVDANFPPNDESLGQLNYLSQFPVKWLRPNEIAKNMLNGAAPFFRGPYDEFGVNQGAVGDCWLLAVIADSALKPDIINNLVPEDNTDECFEVGAFHFRFWCRGKWLDVVVDDNLPCIFNPNDPNQFISTAFTKPTDHAGFWCPLLEKAYAKVNNGYANIDLGYSHEAMEDFTGGVVHLYSISKDFPGHSLKAKFVDSLKLNNLMAIGTNAIPEGFRSPPDPNNPGAEDVSKDGIVGEHAYSVLDIQKIQEIKNPKKKYTLIKCRNPWGNDVEWKGKFSDKDSHSWGKVTSDLRTGNTKDGEFWIPIDNLRFYADKFYDCRWSGNYRGTETCQLPSGYTNYIVNGNFTEKNSGSVSVGRNYMGKWGYYVYLKATDPNSGLVKADGLRYNCTVNITMQYKDYKRCGLDKSIPTYGFAVNWAPGHLAPTLDTDFFYDVNFGVFTENPFTHYLRGINVTADLPEGTLFIIPWLDTWDGQDHPFFLRIIANGEFNYQPEFEV